MIVDTKDPRNREKTRNRPRGGAWPLIAAALLAIGCLGVVVALDAPHQQRNSIRLVSTGEEAGWWSRISVEQIHPAAPATPATPATPALVRASIPSDVLFAFGSVKLDDTAREVLRQVATRLAQSSGPIAVDGHTDLRGDDDGNMQLGEERAGAVARLLVELGAPAERMDITSFGETQPICQQVNADGSDNADCRARCRRVVITYRTKN